MPSDRDGHSLLEREREVAELTAACRAAAAGRGRVLAIEGPAGIGKTALLDAGRRAAADAGLTVLAGSGSQLERELAFGVVRQLFERPLRHLGDDPRSEILAGASALALPILLEPDPTPTADVVHAATHGLYWLAAELAAQAPLLLAVDDAHWADAASLRWLAYLGRRLDGVALLVLVARRAGEPGADLDLHDRVVAAALAAVLRPAPLGEPAVARLLATSYEGGVAPEFVRACTVVTGGNPFLLRELIASLLAGGVSPDAMGADAVNAVAPTSIARAVLQRLTPLGPEALAVAEATSVLSTDARLDRVAAVAGVPVERTAELLDRLATAGILVDGDPLQFRHPIQRSAVHDQTPVQRRGLAHLTAAELLLTEGAAPERVASHLLAGPPGGQLWVSETLRSAAAAASARGAPDASVVLLRRALVEGGSARATVLLELANAEFTIRDPAAVEHARAALEAAESPAARVYAGLAAARALTSLARHDEATEALAIVDREAAALDPPTRKAVQAEALMLTVWHRGPAAFGELLHGLRLEEMPVSTPIERLLLATRVMQLMSEGRIREPMLKVARRVLARADAHDPADEHPILITSRVLALSDEVGEALAKFSALIDAARARGAIATVATALAMRGEAGFRAGRLAEAEADGREAVALVTEHDIPVLIPAAIACLVDVLVELEPAQRALELLQRHFPPEAALPRGYSGMMVLFAQGRAAAAAGDVTDAAIRFESCGLAQADWGERNPAPRPWRSSLALALGALGRDEEARRLVDDELRLTRAFGAARAVGIALRARALLVSGEQQVARLQEAAHVLSGSPAGLEYTRTLVDLGAALRRTGNRSEARGILVPALERCHEHRANVLAERCRDELGAAGARPRRERLTGPESLTASERRVAELAAKGLTNRQIAQALFVTSKTVETHLGHVYPKLSINGRTELPEVLVSASRPPPRPRRR